MDRFGKKPGQGQMYGGHPAGSPHAQYEPGAINKGVGQMYPAGHGDSHASRWRGMDVSGIGNGMGPGMNNLNGAYHPGTKGPGMMYPGGSATFNENPRASQGHMYPGGGQAPAWHSNDPVYQHNTSGYNPYQPQPGQVMQPGYNPNGQDYETPYTALLRKMLPFYKGGGMG